MHPNPNPFLSASQMAPDTNYMAVLGQVSTIRQRM